MFPFMRINGSACSKAIDWAIGKVFLKCHEDFSDLTADNKRGNVFSLCLFTVLFTMGEFEPNLKQMKIKVIKSCHHIMINYDLQNT